MLSSPDERRGGVWHLVRADFPLEAFGHVRRHTVTSCRSERVIGHLYIQIAFSCEQSADYPNSKSGGASPSLAKQGP